MQPGKFEIRTATTEDVGLVLSFIKKLAVYERMRDHVEATEEKLLNTVFCENPCAEVVIAYADDRPVGFALFFQTYSTFLAKPGIYLEDLFVEEDARGNGYGKALLVHLARLAVQRNCGRLEWSVLDWNKPSIDFYESLGAKCQETWNLYRLTGTALTAVAETGPKLV
jgi:GNAT superfamily N-acetyltransferase